MNKEKATGMIVRRSFLTLFPTSTTETARACLSRACGVSRWTCRLFFALTTTQSEAAEVDRLELSDQLEHRSSVTGDRCTDRGHAGPVRGSVVHSASPDWCGYRRES